MYKSKKFYAAHMFSTKIALSHSRDFRDQEVMREHVRYVGKKIMTTRLLPRDK